METQIQGNNAVEAQPTQDPKSLLEAQIKQFEAQHDVLTGAVKSVPVTAPVDAQTQPVVNPPAEKVPPAENKTDSLQQFRDKEGKVDVSKIEKSNEHLQKSIESKESQLLRLNKELLQKHTKISQDLKQQAKPAETPSSFDGETLSPEFKKKLADDFEKDPLEALFRFNRAVAQYEADRKMKPFEPVMNDVTAYSKATREAMELDEVAKAGNDWVYNEQEREARFGKVFQQYPQLLQFPEPYKAALRFMDDVPSQKESAAGHARTGGTTPILGANHAVPPPSSAPTASHEQKLETLSQELHKAMSQRDFVAANAIQKNMDKVVWEMTSR